MAYRHRGASSATSPLDQLGSEILTPAEKWLPSGYVKIAIENDPVEIVGIFPAIKWWIFPVRYVTVYQRVPPNQSPSIFFWEDYKNLLEIKDGRKTAISIHL